MGFLPTTVPLTGSEKEAALERRIASVERATQKRLARGEPVWGWDVVFTAEERAHWVRCIFETEEQQKPIEAALFQEMLHGWSLFKNKLSWESRTFLLQPEVGIRGVAVRCGERTASRKRSAPVTSPRHKSPLTGMMQQWAELKALHPGTILLMRVGDFFETFEEAGCF